MKSTHVFAHRDNPHSVIDEVHPMTGLSVICGQSLEEIQAREPDACVMSWDEWIARKAVIQQTPIEWVPTTFEKYHEMLNCLPPAFWRDGLFLVGEPEDHDVTTGRARFAAFKEWGGTFTAASRPITIKEAHELTR